MDTQPSPAWLQRYLDLLGVEYQQPDWESLARLTRAHTLRIAFENVSSILRRQANPSGAVPGLDFDVILETWLEGRAGGVCFEITPMFERLLCGLGYRVHTAMADSSFPGSHQALVVQLGDTRYLVDVGNSAPLFEPVPLTGEFEVFHAGLGYRFHADAGETDVWRIDRFIDSAWAPFMRYHLRPATDAAREAAYQRHHTPGQSWVVDSLRIMQCSEHEVGLIRDERFTRFTATGKQVQHIENRTAYIRIVADALGMPALPVGAAVDALNQRNRCP